MGLKFGGGEDPVSVHVRGHREAIKDRAMRKYLKGGAGLTDRGSRAFAETLTPGSAEHRAYTTFIESSTGIRKAKGFMQTIGHTASTLGYGTTGLLGAVTIPWTEPSQSNRLGGRGGVIGNGRVGILSRGSGAPGGRGRGVGWAFGGKPMGLPPGDEEGGGIKGLLTVGGLAYIVLKVLL